MSEGQDAEDKTHDASERRIEQSLEKGEVPRSQELNGFFTLTAGALAVFYVLSGQGAGFAVDLAGMLANVHRPVLREHAPFGSLEGLLSTSTFQVIRVILVPCLAVMIAAIVANLLMHRPMITTEPLMPKGSRISPFSGAKRLFGVENLIQFGKTAAKLTLVSSVLLSVLWPNASELAALVQVSDAASIMHSIATACAKVFGAVLGLYAVIALGDAVYQRFAWLKRLRMTHQDVKEENKEAEGSPEIKARIRQIRNQRMRQRMMAAVPQATVIITNPTHYAVALRFEKGMAAPVCLAKGVDEIALKIREIAGDHRIPIVENPPLARALHAIVEIDQEIPSDHYKAVAEVIGYVLRLKNRRSGRQMPL